MKTKIVFCILNNNFTQKFVESWTNFIYEIGKFTEIIEPQIIFSFELNEFDMRNNVLGYSHDSNKLFMGEIDYDYIFCIDSDMIFDKKIIFNMIFKLEKAKQKFIICPNYKMSNQKSWAIKDFSDTLFAQGDYKYFSDEELYKWGHPDNDYLVPVLNTGVKFFAAPKGLFEKISYPFFKKDLIHNFFNEPTFLDSGLSLSANLFKYNMMTRIDSSLEVYIDQPPICSVDLPSGNLETEAAHSLPS